MTTGANKDGFHLRGVAVERDIEVSQWADLRTAQAGFFVPKGRMFMPNHLTPEELSKELGIDRQEVIRV